MAELRLANVSKRYRSCGGIRDGRGVMPGGTGDHKSEARVLDGGSDDRFVGRRGACAGVFDVTLVVPDGTTLVLFGPSGSGKTTLLRLIAGVESCDSGQIWLGDREITSAISRDRSVSMVAQFPALYPHLTVRANLAFGLSNSNALGVFDVLRRVLGMSSGKLDRHAPETSVREELWRHVIRDLRLTELLDRFPHQLSGGERQRVALGRAVVREPAVFLFDEPLTAIDAQHRWQVRADLARLLRGNAATAVYVTHDFAEAMTLGDRVAIVDSGVVRQVGTPLDVYRHPESLDVARWFGPRGINQVSARWIGGWLSQRLPGRTGGGGRNFVDLGIDLEQVVVAIRPEAVRLACSGPIDLCGGDQPRLFGQICSIEDLGCDRWLQVKLTLEHLDAADLVWANGVNATENRGRTNEYWWVRDACGVDVVSGWRLGQLVRLELPAEQLHFFDATSGQSLGKEFNEAQ
ncbi:MAG: ABC transporter ATP-binding protein [Planctomycetaceae bacterium]|nr:ABC transporter ATP-binding protein [Planctomycetaceae bacterium]